MASEYIVDEHYVPPIGFHAPAAACYERESPGLPYWYAWRVGPRVPAGDAWSEERAATFQADDLSAAAHRSGEVYGVEVDPRAFWLLVDWLRLSELRVAAVVSSAVSGLVVYDDERVAVIAPVAFIGSKRGWLEACWREALIRDVAGSMSIDELVVLRALRASAVSWFKVLMCDTAACATAKDSPTSMSETIARIMTTSEGEP